MPHARAQEAHIRWSSEKLRTDRSYTTWMRSPPLLSVLLVAFLLVAAGQAAASGPELAVSVQMRPFL